MNGWSAASLASQFGLAVISALAGGAIAGRYLDGWLGTSPIFLLVGLLGGFFTSIYLIVTIYRVQALNPVGPKTRDARVKKHGVT